MRKQMKPTHYCLTLDEFIYGYTDAVSCYNDRGVYYVRNSYRYTAEALVEELKDAMPDITEDEGANGEFFYFVDAALYPYGTCYFTLCQY
jgi:hypothetical protein